MAAFPTVRSFVPAPLLNSVVRHPWIERHVSVVIIREFDHLRDGTAVRDCFIELQNYERQLDPGKPEGSTIAEAYLNQMFARCREWEGRVFVAEVAGQVVGFACVWARVRPDEPDGNRSRVE
jgi:hypothetical protein